MIQKIKKMLSNLITVENIEVEKKEKEYDFYEVHKDALNRDWTQIQIKKEEKKEEEQNKAKLLEEMFLKQKLPLLQGDKIIMKDGKIYSVCKKTMKGITTKYEVTLLWENRPNNYFEEDNAENFSFGSLRELTYYIEKELDEIKQIKKTFKNPYEPKKSIEELHEEALKENERINNILKNPKFNKRIKE